MKPDIQTPTTGYDLLKLKEQQSHKHKIYIGIDTGVHTGVAFWETSTKSLTKVSTMKIHEAMKLVEDCIYRYGAENVMVRFEDARLRKWFGNAGREQLQGAGSIKRDCTIWNDFLSDLKIEFKAVAPKNNTTKMSAEQFKRITKWEGRTNEHSRDATFLVFGI
jgi:hypothetical protein